MITVKNVRTLTDDIIDYTLPFDKTEVIEANKKLLIMPALIDPHIRLRNDEWETAAADILKGGVTTLIEIPARSYPANNPVEIEKKKALIEKRLKAPGLPLNYLFYGKGDLDQIEKIGAVKHSIIGLVLSFEHEKEVHHRFDLLFQRAAWENLPVIINTYNENLIERIEGETLLEKALFYAEKHSARLFVFNVSNAEEIRLIQEARKRALLIYAETTLRHLLQKDQMEADGLWEALDEGVIEAIGSGYDPHEERDLTLLHKGRAHHLLNPLFMLPWLLTAALEKRISLEKVVQATAINVKSIFELEDSHDAILVDMEKEEEVEKVNGVFSGKRMLKGWPAYVISKGQLIKI
ncbi:MAG: dihydroorotase family protein [Parachlamydia sp.]|jgi:dihydroorotase|nr:dihydroorotase family protein [Parachlamydia sp.]